MNLRVMRNSMVAAFVASIAMSGHAWSQSSVAYSSQGATIGIGNPSAPYDTLSLSAASGTISGTGLISLGTLTYTAGLNEFTNWNCAGVGACATVTGTFTNLFTLGGTTQSINIGATYTDSVGEFGWDSIQTKDTVVSIGGYTLDVQPIALWATSGGGSTMSKTWYANVTQVPATAAPELDAGSIAGGLSLLIGGLLVMRGRRPVEAELA